MVTGRSSDAGLGDSWILTPVNIQELPHFALLSLLVPFLFRAHRGLARWGDQHWFSWCRITPVAGIHRCFVYYYNQEKVGESYLEIAQQMGNGMTGELLCLAGLSFWVCENCAHGWRILIFVQSFGCHSKKDFLFSFPLPVRHKGRIAGKTIRFCVRPGLKPALLSLS